MQVSLRAPYEGIKAFSETGFTRDLKRFDVPTLIIHGWPLSADDWDAQLLFFLGKGYRVIAHDRRGHGRSAQDGTRPRHGSLC
jgi:pimeloyl-ACP methyl ester carboxylesterase